MLDKGQRELADLLKEGAAALVQMRKGIENACADLRYMYSRTTAQYLLEQRRGTVVDSKTGKNDMGNELLPLPPVDGPYRLS